MQLEGSLADVIDADFQLNHFACYRDFQNELGSLLIVLQNEGVILATIRSLQQEGATLLPELDLTLLEIFSRIAGEKFVDAWIRREVSNFIGNEITGKSGVTIIGSPNVKQGVIFLTCDLRTPLPLRPRAYPLSYCHVV